jgi:hypothetical protein
LIFAAVKRDFFLWLWVIPFLIFLYIIDYVSAWHLMPLIPAFCIAASRFLVEITGKIKFIKKYKVQQILPFAVISGIIIFGLVSTTMLITTNVNSTSYKALAAIVQKLPNRDDINSTADAVTLVGAPTYFPMPKYAFDKPFYEHSYFSRLPLDTQKYILVADRGLMQSISGTSTRAPNALMKYLYENSHIIDTIVPDDKTKYNVKEYPYSNMRQNPRSTQIEIRSNY